MLGSIAGEGGGGGGGSVEAWKPQQKQQQQQKQGLINTIKGWQNCLTTHKPVNILTRLNARHV